MPASTGAAASQAPAVNDAAARNVASGRHAASGWPGLRTRLGRHKYLYLLIAPALVLVFVFQYLPMYGVVIAFQDYRAADGFFDGDWVGLRHFANLFTSPRFPLLIRNTLAISLLKLVFGFPAPIILALLLNEISQPTFKKTVQTISFLPFFMSWVVLAGVVIAALILPMLVNVFHLLIVRTYVMATVERSLEESAQIDGANHVTIMLRIVMPVCKPVIGTLALWTIVAHWNSWFDAMIYMNDPGKTVLQLQLRRIWFDKVARELHLMEQYAIESRLDYNALTLQAAFLFVTIAPILLVYPFLQRYFVKGIMLGSLKG